MILLSSHSPSVEAAKAVSRRRQWGQLGEIGGVATPVGMASHASLKLQINYQQKLIEEGKSLKQLRNSSN
jgi:hypothetical protein